MSNNEANERTTLFVNDMEPMLPESIRMFGIRNRHASHACSYCTAYLNAGSGIVSDSATATDRHAAPADRRD